MASGSKLLLGANAIRAGRSDITSFDLWLLADRESSEQAEVRVRLFRHALIHAGRLTDEDGSPYRRCPVCSEPLHP